MSSAVVRVRTPVAPRATSAESSLVTVAPFGSVPRPAATALLTERGGGQRRHVPAGCSARRGGMAPQWPGGRRGSDGYVPGCGARRQRHAPAACAAALRGRSHAAVACTLPFRAPEAAAGDAPGPRSQHCDASARRFGRARGARRCLRARAGSGVWRLSPGPALLGAGVWRPVHGARTAALLGLAADVRARPGDLDPDQAAAVAHHGGAVVIPVRVLARDESGSTRPGVPWPQAAR